MYCGPPLPPVDVSSRHTGQIINAVLKLWHHPQLQAFFVFLITIMPGFKRLDLSELPPGLDLSQIPSGIPPDGVIPNFVDPENVGYIPQIGIYVLFPLMLVAVLCRIGTRLKLTRTVGLDDGTHIPTTKPHCLAMFETSY